MVLPAYWLRAGLGSKLSTWLVPPTMNSQMTLLALGGKCGLPSGGDQRPSSAHTTPSRASMAPRARPVKPMPTSARNARRVGQQEAAWGAGTVKSSASRGSGLALVADLEEYQQSESLARV